MMCPCIKQALVELLFKCVFIYIYFQPNNKILCSCRANIQIMYSNEKSNVNVSEWARYWAVSTGLIKGHRELVSNSLGRNMHEYPPASNSLGLAVCLLCNSQFPGISPTVAVLY